MPRQRDIQIRNGTAAQWTSANPVLDVGELGVETDTHKLKVGDGTTAWNSLPYDSTGAGLSAPGSGMVKSTGSVLATAIPSTDYQSVVFSSVKDYGAKGDGTTDDTTAIANAITAASGSGGSGVVYFPPGTYITSPITVPGATTLLGANGGGYISWVGTSPNVNTVSQLKLKAASSGPLISPYDGGSVPSAYVTLRNLWLNCNGINQPAINLADNGSGQQRNWLIDQCNVYNVNSANTTSGYAVYIGQGQAGICIRNSTIFNGMGGSGTRMGYNGLGWYGSDGLIYNLWLGGFTNAGFTALGGANDYTFNWIGGGVFWNNTNVIGGGGFTFTGVSFDHHQNDGVYIGSNGGNVTTFVGCSFHTNSMQTTNTWSHINVAGTSLYVNLAGCHTEKRDSGATSNNPAYFINNTGGTTNTITLTACSDGSGGQLGTAWSASCPQGIYSNVNFNTSSQSQVTIAGTAYYIAGSALALPAVTGMVANKTTFTWNVAMNKDANGTGTFQLILYRGTNGTTSDTADVTQTLGTMTAAADQMTVEVQLTVTTVGGTGAYFWSIIPTHTAASAAGFGITTGSAGQLSGTVSSVALNTASLIFGLGFKANTGGTMPTIGIPRVQSTSYNIV